MKGLITKRDLGKVLRVFGFKAALKMLFTKNATALSLLYKAAGLALAFSLAAATAVPAYSPLPQDKIAEICTEYVNEITGDKEFAVYWDPAKGQYMLWGTEQQQFYFGKCQSIVARELAGQDNTVVKLPGKEPAPVLEF